MDAPSRRGPDSASAIAGYFAYGSNMNPQRVLERGLSFVTCAGATLADMALVFDKSSSRHPHEGHANIVYDPGGVVEGVLYGFDDPGEILKMDPYERTPVNYSREIVQVCCEGTRLLAWTYFANPAVRRAGLRPSTFYLGHLLAGSEFLSAAYVERLRAMRCADG